MYSWLWKPSKALRLCLTHGRCGAGNENRQCTVTACLRTVDNCPPLLPQVVLWGRSLGDLHSGLVGHSHKGRPRAGPLMLGVELPCACVLHPLHVCMSGVSAVSTYVPCAAGLSTGRLPYQHLSNSDAAKAVSTSSKLMKPDSCCPEL